MKWNWQKEEWPDFKYQEDKLSELEAKFLHEAGVAFGALKHLSEDEKNRLTVEIISSEAVKTSEIEGEILNRDSVQSSILKNLGLSSDSINAKPEEQGIAEMMVDLYKTYKD